MSEDPGQLAVQAAVFGLSAMLGFLGAFAIRKLWNRMDAIRRMPR